MSYLGIIATSVLASNALLSYGFGMLPGTKDSKMDGVRHGGDADLASAIALTVVNAIAAAVLWCLRTLVLEPLGLASLDIFFFAVMVVPPLKAVSRAASKGRGVVAAVGSEADELVVGSLVFGIALIAVRSGYALEEAVTAAAASGLGYWMATALLTSIRERLELSDLPRSFKGAPAMLISAALMSMALMGIDSGIVSSLGGAP